MSSVCSSNHLAVLSHEMLRSRAQDLSRMTLLCKQLDSLTVTTCSGDVGGSMQSKRTTTTRIKPRGWRMPKYRSYADKYWSRARHFPPNWGDEHHLFYPNLTEHFQQRQMIENPIKLVDIGYHSKSESNQRKDDLSTQKTSRAERRKSSSTVAAAAQISSPEQILALIDQPLPEVKFDYNVYIQKWLNSEQGVNENQQLAHHYQIYRDLFSSPNQTPAVDPVPQVEFADFYPRPEFIHPEVYEQFFPGAVRANRLPTPQNVYHFRPIVPLYAEFAVPDHLVGDERDDMEGNGKEGVQPNQTESDELQVSPVYRGNLIKPRYAQSRPAVLIDSSVFGQDSSTLSTTSTYGNLMADGQTKVIGNDSAFYTVCLLALDTIFGDADPVCHWMQSNIHSQSGPGIEQYSYLPVYGVKGLGYHRFAFLLFRHDQPLKLHQPITSNNLKERKFSPLTFMKTHQQNQQQQQQIRPVGLSWFQSTYDDTCKRIFHDHLNMKMPVYEYVQPKLRLNKQVKFPGPAPFNLYLDHFRDPKEIAREVLLERLSSVDPFDYRRQIQPKTLPPNIYKIAHDSPSWLRSVIWKRRNQLGAYRMLRPASAVRSLNNNADLDKPFWPHPSRLEVAMRYPFEKRSPRPLRETKWSLPPHEHPTIRIEPNVDTPKDSAIEAKQFDDEISAVNSK